MNASISKAWDWAQVPQSEWNEISDEFLPVATRWRALSKLKVLDLGCGRGRLSIFLADLGFSVTAVDLSPNGIEQLRAEAVRKCVAGKIETLICDMNDLPFEDGTFDCVLGFHSIYHTTYENLKAIIAKLTVILREKGRMYLTFNSKSNPSYDDPSVQRMDEYTVVKTTGIEDGIPHTYLDYPDILDLLQSYKILKIQHIQEYQAGRTSFHYFLEVEKTENGSGNDRKNVKQYA